MNVADTELVSAMLNDSGYEETNDINLADAIFVNTCAIREHAEDKVHSRLGFYHKIKNQKPSTIIGVLGCMAQNLKEDIGRTLLFWKANIGIINLRERRRLEKSQAL